METDLISGLIHTLEQSRADLAWVARRLSDLGNEQLSERFVALAKQRARFAQELDEMARGQRIDIDEPASATLSLDERSMELSGSSTIGSSAALALAAAGEKDARARFRDALANPDLNSTGVHALIKGKRTIHEKGSAIYLVASPPVRRLLEMVSPGPLFAARFDSMEEAMAHVDPQQEQTRGVSDIAS